MALPAFLHSLHPPLPAGRVAWATLAAADPRRRAWPAAVLALAVLGGHAWLASLWQAGPPRAGLPRAVAVQLRGLPAAVPSPAPPAVATPVLPRHGARTPPPVDPAPPPAAAAAAGLPPPAARPAAALADATPADPPAPAMPPPPALAAAGDPAAGTDDGEPPPVYATRVPPPVQLRYALQYNGRSGEALLTWQHDGSRYRLTLDGSTATGQPLVAQASEGAFDSHGLAPERYTDRRSGGRLRAANFRRDIGRIGYSGPSQQHPAWPGAQDRLSWLAQLAAILAAAADAPAAAVPQVADGQAGGAAPALHLFVADALGNAGLWHFERQPDTAGPSPWGDLLQQHWLRLPPRPEGLRIDVWFAAPGQPGGADAMAAGQAAPLPAGTWPLRLRFAVPRSGDVFALQLLGAP